MIHRVTDVMQAVQVIGTLGLGSVLGQYLSSGGQRRKTRADVLVALAACEQARWHPHNEGEPTLVTTGRDLQTSAMLARVPPQPVRVYLGIAGAASRASRDFWERHGDDESGGAIDTDMALLASDAAAMISDLAWAPWRHRWRLKARIEHLKSRTSEVQQANHVDWKRI